VVHARLHFPRAPGRFGAGLRAKTGFLIKKPAKDLLKNKAKEFFAKKS
jgi:hypothetical protein